MNEYQRFGHTFYKVSFCFLISLNILVIPSFLFDFIFNTQLIDWLTYSNTGHAALVILGLFGLTWIVRDGEFIDDVKSSHYSRKHIND
tara:strand:- start:74723 stop:74986 length:264 start_codon:yes stop_codon:yes gene_type:complete